MIRWFQQRDQYSCGPVAILNALKWSGVKVNEKRDLPILKKECNTDRTGTDSGWLRVAICHYMDHVTFLPQKDLKKISLRSIDSHLNKGGACIFSLYVVEKGIRKGHYVFCPGHTKHYYQLVNWFPRGGLPIAYVSKEKVKKMLRESIRDDQKFRNIPVTFLVKT